MTLLLSIASFCPRQAFKSFQVDELMKMFPSSELEALRGQLQNYIKDVRGYARFKDLKRLGDLAKWMVETNKHEIYPKSDLCNKVGDAFINNCMVAYIENDVFNSISNNLILGAVW
ncbi:hypothetical protein OSB04_un000606 [Centaurea solstitialis]|uniref:Uncharacterized protein n=1 Tax=Centaurea solstitialis TaxID=347529 RepID=A0AA38S4R8_9ASTR|nr:hypothetical protein OSB04_un000606 [Centaurea solstitialis]